MASPRKQAASRMLRAQRARQMSGLPTAGWLGDALGFVGKVAGAFIPGVSAAVDIAQAIGGGKKAAPAPVPVPRPLATGCPTGFEINPATGLCEKVGFVGAVQRLLPGGATGTAVATTDFGAAVIGAFGRPALEPAVSTGVVRRCPKGAFLGTDNLCYEKLPREFRKWPPPTKPPISSKDWKALQVSNRVREKSKKIASAAGFTCKKR